MKHLMMTILFGAAIFAVTSPAVAQIVTGNSIPVHPDSFHMEDFTAKQKFSATFKDPFPKNTSKVATKKVAVKLNKEMTALDVKGTVPLLDKKTFNKAKKGKLTNGIGMATAQVLAEVSPPVQKTSVPVIIEPLKVEGDTVTMYAYPPQIKSAEICTVLDEDGFVDQTFAILAVKYPGSKLKASMEMLIPNRMMTKVSVKTFKLPVAKATEAKPFPAIVQNRIASLNTYYANDKDVEVFVYKLSAKLEQASLNAYGIYWAVDNKNGVAGEIFVPAVQ